MASNFAGMKILLVEDDHFTRLLARRILAGLGVGCIVECADGRQALNLGEGDVAAVLTDLVMQPLDGLGLCRAIRAGRGSLRPDTPVVMMTASTDLESVKAARDAGVDELLAKPLSMGAVERRLTAALARPRGFVVSTVYTGPDRRRRQASLPRALDRRGREGA